MPDAPLLFELPEPRADWQKTLPYGLLLSITFGLYASALYFDFLWDDGIYVLRNFRIRSLTWNYLTSIWGRSYLGNYAPVHNTFLALIYHFFGLNPLGYHLSQILLHAACVCLVYLLLKKLEAPRVALLASLLFVVHPTNIETAAWVSETKSTLALLFFLLSFWFFIRFREREQWWDGLLVGVFLALSVLSKINTVVAPAIFLLYDYKRESRFDRSQLLSLGSFFLISGIFTVVHLISFEGSPQVLENSYGGGLLQHWQNMPFVLWFYLRMAIFPYPLSAAESIRIYHQFDWNVGLAWTSLILALLLLRRADRKVRFWALWFVVFLIPVLQIIPNSIWVADRYLYVPLIGMAVLWSELFFWIADRCERWWRRLGWEVAMAAVLVAFAWQTHSHLQIWRNNLSLWEGTIKTCMPVAYCHLGLGQALIVSGQVQRGGDEFVRAVQLEPSPLNLMYLGDALTDSARNYPEAIRIYQAALKAAASPRAITGRSVMATLNSKLARAYIYANQFGQAALALQAGRSADPNNLGILTVEGFLKWKLGDRGAARQYIQTVVSASGGAAPAAEFIDIYWPNRGEVNQLLADLRSDDPVASGGGS
jgi:protein O-mannosyl-transferase